MPHGRARLTAITLLALAGCATQGSYRTASEANAPAMPPPAPATTATTPVPATTGTRCVAGIGVVARMAADAGAASTMLQGGVLGGVLGDDGAKSGSAPATTTPPAHDIYVRMDDGRKLILSQHDIDGIVAGARVSVDASCRARPLR